jgi:hypothetical protein
MEEEENPGHQKQIMKAPPSVNIPRKKLVFICNSLRNYGSCEKWHI